MLEIRSTPKRGPTVAKIYKLLILLVICLLATTSLISTDTTFGQDEEVPEWAQALAEEIGGGVRPQDLMGPPGNIQPDIYLPDQRPTKPALGGSVTISLLGDPKGLNGAVENSAVGTAVRRVIHAALLRRNYETWDYDPELAKKEPDIEDALILKDGTTLFGKVEEFEDHYQISSGSTHNPIEPQQLPMDEVDKLLRGTVFTFELRDDVTWHDDHPFNLDDVVFSVEIYKNPKLIDAQHVAEKFRDIRIERVNEWTVRFFLPKQHYDAKSHFGKDLCLLPRHLYDLSDPDNKDYDPKASDFDQAVHVEKNSHNIDFVGLGPYRLTRYDVQWIDTERYEDYFETDPAKRGYLDEIGWRIYGSRGSAWTGLIDQGELDLNDVCLTESWNTAGKREVFTKSFYRASVYPATYFFEAVNMQKPKFKDPDVRRALAYALDPLDYVAANDGLAIHHTGINFFGSPAYNHAVKPIVSIPPDIGDTEREKLIDQYREKAKELLTDAGWYDRDGDGVRDKYGQPFEIDYLYPKEAPTPVELGQKMQEVFANHLGIKVNLVPREWVVFQDERAKGNFDILWQGWSQDPMESDPYHPWHGEQVGKEAQNFTGYDDEVSNGLIEKGRRELDREKRHAIWHELHRRIYHSHAYLSRTAYPRLFAVRKTIRGLKLTPFFPGYDPLDFYYEEGTPGTRPLEQPEEKQD